MPGLVFRLNLVQLFVKEIDHDTVSKAKAAKFLFSCVSCVFEVARVICKKNSLYLH